MSYNEFNASYPTANTNYLFFEGIIRSLKQYQQKCKVILNSDYKIVETKAVQCVNNGNKSVRVQLMNSEVEASAVKKWNETYPNLNWSNIFSKCRKITVDTKLKWFQIRLLHSILPTNRFLYICNIKDSSTCSFCKTEEETITHLIWSCPVVQAFSDFFFCDPFQGGASLYPVIPANRRPVFQQQHLLHSLLLQATRRTQEIQSMYLLMLIPWRTLPHRLPRPRSALMVENDGMAPSGPPSLLMNGHAGRSKQGSSYLMVPSPPSATGRPRTNLFSKHATSIS